MTVTQKIEKLNRLAEQIRNAVRDSADLFKDNETLAHIVWRINKQISLLQQEVCKTLEKEVTNEEFKRIIEMFDNENL